MKKISTTVAIITGLALSMPCSMLKAGNPARAGQAGATELLIDPWP